MEARRAYMIVVREVRRGRGENIPEVREALYTVKKALRLEPLQPQPPDTKKAPQRKGCEA